MKNCNIENCRGCSYEVKKEVWYTDRGFWACVIIGVMIILCVCFG